jgi:hypothetical protein
MKIKNLIQLFSLKYLTLFFMLTVVISNARALEVENKVWGDVTINSAFIENSKLRYWIQPQVRFNLNPDQFETGFLMSGLGYQYSPRLGFWAGYLWEAGNSLFNHKPTNRIWQQMIWQIVNEKTVVLISRSRLEEINRLGQSEWLKRTREYMELDFPKVIFKKCTLIFYDEIFINSNRTVWTADQPTFEQNRLFVGIGIPISKHLVWRVGYLNRYLFRYSGDRMNHILYTSLLINT